MYIATQEVSRYTYSMGDLIKLPSRWKVIVGFFGLEIRFPLYRKIYQMFFGK